MNVLILGSGGREHAFSWKLSQSRLLTKLFIAPGNAGTEELGENIYIDINDFYAIKSICISKNINMVVVGPEKPLVNGIHDFFLSDPDLKNIVFIGPQQAAAQLEGSKKFAKEFMNRYKIPTAKYKIFTSKNLKEGYVFLDSLTAPYVLKADGLAAGKGVLILNSLSEAKIELKEMLTKEKFGSASSKVIIEEFLDGIEMSTFVLTDGDNYQILPTAKDYKRIGEEDKGLNTGGMGAISPVLFADELFMKKIDQQIISPTVQGLKKDNLPYKGFIFIGLIKVNNEPYVIEYNVRMGDPETEAVLPRIKSDLLELLIAVGENKLNEKKIEIDSRFATTVMIVSGGYPGKYVKGLEIKGTNNINQSILFHAGTVINNKKLETSGGRVMAITSLASSMNKALSLCYKNVDKISFKDKYFRKDIGFDL